MTVRGQSKQRMQLFVGTDSAAVADRKGNVWNSGKIKSGQNLVRYEGMPLEAFTRYYWSVIIWDQNHKPSVNTPVAFFETGMIEEHELEGKLDQRFPGY